MTLSGGNVLVVMSEQMRDQDLLDLLERHHFTVDLVASLSDAMSHFGPEVPRLMIVVAETDIFADSSDGRVMRQLAERTHTIVILDRPTAEQVVSAYRNEAKDVILAPVQEKELLNSFNRVSQFLDFRTQNLRYREELERTNHELQENLRQLKLDQLAGLEVQRSLLPPSPMRMGQYEISHRISPSLYLSGDFVGYNFVLDRFILFYFADVSGHGASSAFVTVLLRFMINRVIRKHVKSHDVVALAQAPEGLIEYINSHLLSIELDKHITIVAGSLDTHQNRLRYSVGAQMPMPVMIEKDFAYFVEGKGKPAGIFPNVTWAVEEMELPEEFSLAILSDGILDLLPSKSLKDKEADMLVRLTQSHDSVDQIFQAFNADQVEEPQDDITAVLIRRSPNFG